MDLSSLKKMNTYCFNLDMGSYCFSCPSTDTLAYRYLVLVASLVKTCCGCVRLSCPISEAYVTIEQECSEVVVKKLYCLQH